MTDRNVKFCAIGRLEDKVVVLAHVFGQDKDYLNTALSNAKRIMGSSKISTNPKMVVRAKSLGNFHYNVMDNNVYMVITDPDYPQRVAYRFLNELKSEVLKQFPSEIGTATEDNKIKATILCDTLMDKYDDPANVDTAQAVKAQVDQGKSNMQSNIQKIVERGGQIDEVSTKAESLQANTGRFEKNSTELARIMKWRELKLKIILGILVMACVLYVVLPIVQSVTGG